MIVFVRGKNPTKETIDLANEEEIPLSQPSLVCMMCGILYHLVTKF